MKKSLLVGINERCGVAFAKAAAREFDAPLVSVCLYQYIEQAHPEMERELRALGSYYSVPAFYFEHIAEVRALSLEELDKQQREIEERLGVENSNLLASYDRMMMSVGDFRSYRNLQLVNLMLADKVFAENEIGLCSVGYGVYLWQLLIAGSRKLGVETMAFYYDRLTCKRMVAVTPQGHMRGAEETFHAMRRGDEVAIPAEDKEWADRYYHDFVNKPKRPSFTEITSRSLSKSFLTLARGGVASIRENMRMYRENEYDRVCGRLESSVKSMANWPAKFLNMTLVERGGVLVDKPDLSRKFCYLPLHMKPEITDMFYGSEYDHHEGFVTQLAKRLPSGYSLYVKEHTSMIGRRPLSFYRTLSRLPNVEMISPRVSTFDLIQNGVTLVVTGTAGWEAYLLDRPAIVLGNVFYNFLPGVLHARLADPDFTRQVEEYVGSFKADPEERLTAVRACMMNSILVDAGLNVLSEESVEDSVDSALRGWRVLYERFGRGDLGETKG